MKKLIILLFCSFLLLSGKTQTRGIDTFGVWFQTNFTSTNILSTFGRAKNNFLGGNLVGEWKDIRPLVSGPYQWIQFDANVNELADSGYFLQIQFNTGQGSPSDVLAASGSYNTTGHPDTGPYPYYYNPVYKAYVFQFIRDYVTHLKNLPTNTKNHILAVFDGFGSTGDLGPNKGTPSDYNYDGETTINDADVKWIAFRHEYWDSVKAIRLRIFPELKMVCNGGNNGEEYSYTRVKFGASPGVLGKEGDVSHGKSFRGEKTYYQRDSTWEVRTGIKTPYYTRGEMQADEVLNPLHPHRETMAQFKFMKAMDLTFPNWTGAMFNVLEAGEIATPYIYVDFFNKYSGYRFRKKRGFNYPHRIPDFIDTLRFPSSIYGDVIDPAQIDDYKHSVKLIKQRTDSIESINIALIKKYEDYINPDRVTNIVAAFPNLQYDINEKYFNDFIIDGLPEYQFNLKLSNIDEATIILARIGPDTSFYGRWAYQLIPGKQAKFDIVDSLSSGSSTDTLQITVHYYDTANYVWKITLPTCNNTVVTTVTNANTRHWKNITVKIPNFKFRKYSYEFRLESNYPFIWETTEVDNLAK